MLEPKPHEYAPLSLWMYVPYTVNVTLQLTTTRPTRQGTPRPGASALGKFPAPGLCLMLLSVLTEHV